MPRDTDRADTEFGLRFQMAHRQSKYYKLNQSELARLWNMGASTVSFWKKGVRVPDSERMKLIASTFEVSADWLYTGREPMRPLPPSETLDLAQQLMSIDQTTRHTLMFFVTLIKNGVLSNTHLESLTKQMIASTSPFEV